ncbi:transmembrane protein, putative [Medicago truncatula]|uniref:Transmembrane protein, putative n=1 Tax=Medicago truncatula TaxID=3880 RepID=A0A072VM94_MEDTR|nr:transmembrane protein, putative [Medicago truncatula]
MYSGILPMDICQNHPFSIYALLVIVCAYGCFKFRGDELFYRELMKEFPLNEDNSNDRLDSHLIGTLFEY